MAATTTLLDKLRSLGQVDCDTFDVEGEHLPPLPFLRLFDMVLQQGTLASHMSKETARPDWRSSFADLSRSDCQVASC